MTFPGTLGVLYKFTVQVQKVLFWGQVSPWGILVPKFGCSPHLTGNTRRLQLKIENGMPRRAFFEMPSKFLPGADHVLGVKSATCSSYVCAATIAIVHMCPFSCFP